MATMMPMELNEGVDGGNPLTQPVLPPSCLNPLADACDDHEDEIGHLNLYITLMHGGVCLRVTKIHHFLQKMTFSCMCVTKNEHFLRLYVCLSPSALPSRCEMCPMYKDGSSTAFENF